MILKTIPKSIRAGVALVLMLVLLTSGLNDLQKLILPEEESGWVVIRCIGAIILGLVSAGVFYYFQSVDGGTKSYNELEILNDYQKAEREKERLKNIEITPAYDEKPDNSIKNDNNNILG